MRSILFVGLILCSALPALAQDNDPDPQDQKAQERIKNLRIAYISDKLGLTTEQAERFWPLYREFAQERSKLRNELKSAERTITPNNNDPKRQQELIDLTLRLKQKELDLEKDYSGRMLQVINAQQILNLRKAEQEFRIMILNQLQLRSQMQQRKENVRDKNQMLKQRNK